MQKISKFRLIKLYIALLNRPISRISFTKKIMLLGLLEDIGELTLTGVGRVNKIYQLNKNGILICKKKAFIVKI